MRNFLWIGLLCSWVAPGQKIEAPRVWNDKDLAEWATPVAGLKVRPGHFSEREYYAAPMAELLRTYPVYFPGREPSGYFESIKQKRPEPLLRPGARTLTEWIRDGRTVFREMDATFARSYDADLAEVVRSADAMARMGARARPDGTVIGLRWVPTAKGLALSIDQCGGCHARVMQDGTSVDGIPADEGGNGVIGQLATRAIGRTYGDSPAVWSWRSSAVPWLPNDIHQAIRSMQPQELRPIFRSMPPETFARFNGSPYFPTKIPDLIGIAERRYIDHTATHRHRGIGDLMRYAALVGCCDIADFGPHRMLSDSQRRIVERFPDDVLFALAQYIYSLQPPPNPHRDDPRVGKGKKVFAREGCAGCHAPPLYTNNKLTPADGFSPWEQHPLAADIMPVRVGTPPELALKTRKGTGLYKVPSLKGVWYRRRLHHDGAIGSLEEWFDPARLAKVKGHPFGVGLSPEDKAALIAFLRSL